MKKAIEELIDRLADKTLSFGCRVAGNDEVPFSEAPIVHYIDDRFYRTVYRDGGRGSMPVNPNRYCDSIVLGHPILIGDILEKVEGGDDGCNRWGELLKVAYPDDYTRYELILEYWQPCGFTRSLQEIYEECEWEKGLVEGMIECNIQFAPVPKQSSHKNLFQFLLNLAL